MQIDTNKYVLLSNQLRNATDRDVYPVNAKDANLPSISRGDAGNFCPVDLRFSPRQSDNVCKNFAWARQQGDPSVVGTRLSNRLSPLYLVH